MVIRSSAATDVERLLIDLRAGPSSQREAAVARLRIIGTRAVTRLIALVAAAHESAAARAAALRTREGSTDSRVRDAAIASLADEAVAAAAVATLRSWVIRDDGLPALEALTALALDAARPAATRLAALDALSQLPADVVQPLIAAVPLESAPETAPHGDPLAAREWLDGHAAAPLSVLHAFVVDARACERQEASPRRREDWRVTRGAAHQAIARRGSRVALYDLKETFDSATAPLPLDFLGAISAIGDGSCLEPLARAWAAAAGDTWWRARLADAAADIMRRERLTGRSAVVRRIKGKFTGFL